MNPVAAAYPARMERQSTSSAEAPLARRLAAAWPYLLLTFGAFAFASNQVLGRALEGVIPPIGLSFWRWLVAALLLYPFVHRPLRADLPRLRGEGWRMAVIAFVLIISGNTTIYVALQYTTAVNAGVVSSSQPALVLLMSWWMLGERFTRTKVLGVAIALSGVLAIIARGDVGVILGLDLNRGDLWIVVSTVSLGLYSVLLRYWPQRLHPLVLVFCVQVIGVVMLVPFYVWETLSGKPMHLDWVTVGMVLWTAVAVANLGMIAWNAGVMAIGATAASTFIYVRMLFITAAALLLLGEVLEGYHVYGVVTIVCGIALVTRRPAPVRPQP
jgi:drug/metabolite transporter (DMT)-like permease